MEYGCPCPRRTERPTPPSKLLSRFVRPLRVAMPRHMLGMLAQRLEGVLGGDRVAGHQDAFCLLNHCSTSECALKVVVLGEALQRDVDRALEFHGIVVENVCEDTTLGRFADVRWVTGGEQRDHWAGRLVDDLGDQVKRVLGAQTEPDKSDVGALPRGHLCDHIDVDLASDHHVPEPGNQLRELLEPVASFVGDQHAEWPCLVHGQDLARLAG